MEKKAINIKQALQIAIEAESHAYEMYTKTSKMVSGADTKQMLLDLAKEELGHKKLLEKIVLEGNPAQLGQGIPKDSYGIADFLVVSELKEKAIPQDIIIFAMKEEEKAFNFYMDLKRLYEGTELEKVFDNLATEEKGHKIKLEAEYEEHFMREN